MRTPATSYSNFSGNSPSTSSACDRNDTQHDLKNSVFFNAAHSISGCTRLLRCPDAVQIILDTLVKAENRGGISEISTISSFGCSSGEEVFTLALATAAYPALSIHGYELYESRLTTANRGYLGRLPAFSSLIQDLFGGRGEEIVSRLLATSHIALNGDQVWLGEVLRERIKLFPVDLLATAPHERCQVGLLFNVLQHYPPEHRGVIIENCAGSVSEGGLLLISDVLLDEASRSAHYGIVEGTIHCEKFCLTTVPWVRTHQLEYPENPLLLRKTCYGARERFA